MKIFDEYFKLEKEIHDHFGYVEDWVTIPLADYRNVYWHLSGTESSSDVVTFAYDKEEFERENYYEYDLYTQRFLSKWVYETKDYTMICCNTNVDGNKYLAIFDNSMQLSDEDFHKLTVK